MSFVSRLKRRKSFYPLAHNDVEHCQRTGRDIIVANLRPLKESPDLLLITRVRIHHHPGFGQPGWVVGTAGFGRITNTRFPTGESGLSRQLQLALKLLS